MRVGNKGYEKNTKGGRTLINHKKLENFVETVTFVFSENFFLLQLFVNLSDLVPSCGASSALQTHNIRPIFHLWLDFQRID